MKLKRRDEVLVGLFTAVAVAVLAIGSVWLARGGVARGYPVYVVFPWGGGLREGQPVLFSGVSVGYVDRVTLQPEGGIVTTLRIQKRHRLPQGTVATVEPNGLFGDMLVALRAVAPTAVSLAPGDTLPAGPDAIDMADVLARVDSVGQHLLRLTAALNTELVDMEGLTQVRRAVTTADETLRSLDRLAADQARELTATQEAVRRAAGAIDSARLDTTLRSVEAAAQSVTRLAEDLRGTTGRLNTLLARVDSGDGAAARLMNDAALYDELRALVRRIDSLATDFQANPRRYIRLSIF